MMKLMKLIHFFSSLPAWMHDNREVVLAVVTESGYALEFASERLQQDPEIRAAAGR
tara:strand:+ start:77 stop:244 length:168 start_codon:yes stop_codon:yes gene_type:complete